MDNRARCGCDVVVDKENGDGKERKNIRLLCVKAYTKILASVSKTTLTQTFENPSLTKSLEELRYVFPLYEGVSVVSFTARVGPHVVSGVIKERSKAAQIYSEAKKRVEVAGLLEQSARAGDVFITKIGSVPAGETISVEIEYLAELKHDAEADAIRFTIPTYIAPRYGPSELLQADAASVYHNEEPFSVIIDAEMPEGSAIQTVQSPSHPIAVQIGKLSRDVDQEEQSLSKASASLALEKAELSADFVIQIAATKLGEPSAMLETHPDLPNQRALMTTLVPKFNIPAEKPEIVFVCDRSGSMGCEGRVPKLKEALSVFLKSLPLGVKFNLVSFGSRHEFLWERSQSYDQDTLDQAIEYIDSFSANLGGTIMAGPLSETFNRRYQDMNLEVFLLTDGQISGQEELFKLIDSHVTESSGAIRLFTVGIGRDASHALIEGAARAGNGFAQTVADNEQASSKFIRMLKASLTPHILNYSLELKYASVAQDAEDEGFELVEAVASMLDLESPQEQKTEELKKTISLYDPTAYENGSTETSTLSTPETLGEKYAHLPEITTPRYIQSPDRVPALFPFNRTTVYILLSNTQPHHQPKSLLLKGTSAHGPLELEIPITVLPEEGTALHQLAARNATRELEEGRGWIHRATHSDSGKLLKEQFDDKFSDMVEREAVQLGVKYQVTGRWTSFVAVAAQKCGENESTGMDVVDGAIARRRACRAQGQANVRSGFACRVGVKKKQASYGDDTADRGTDIRSTAARGGVRGSRGLGVGGAMRHRKVAVAQSQSSEDVGHHGGFSPSSPQNQGSAGQSPPEHHDSSDDEQGFALFDGPSTPVPAQKPALNPLQQLISLQRYDGSWAWSKGLFEILDIGEVQVKNATIDAGVNIQSDDILATVAVILYLETKALGEKDTWEMIAGKAEAWVQDKESTGMYQRLRATIAALVA